MDMTMRDERVAVPAAAGGYEIHLAEGALARLPGILASTCGAARCALVTDETVAALHADRAAGAMRAAGLDVRIIAFPPGERNKTRETWAAVTDAMLAAGLGRDAAVVALGGGVVGDLAGFVAATYMRGVPVVQVPTTLLAMIDASIGGKTGVDTPAGKNLVGAFHPPRAVVADPALLATLPAEHLRAGLAEAVKHGAIADAAYLQWIGANGAALAAASTGALLELVRRSIEIKAGFVARDEHERGPRKLLNFGHTIGHAVETLSGYRLLHGEAVAIGMVAEAALGERLGVTERGSASAVAALLQGLGLPVAAGEFDARSVVEATRADKKARGGQVEYALIRRMGEGGVAPERWSIAVRDADAVASLDALRGDGAPC
jgi:3-dehydroquinate synthase